jgi:ABC-type transport system involved in multi-copper enzyme maturation permease subunit
MNTLRLIAKDLRLQRHFILPLILLELGGYFAYAIQMPSHVPGVAFGLLHGVAFIGDFLICYRTMIAEEKNRALMFIKTLPVSTAEIVMAKFAANLLLVSLNTGAMLTLWGVAHRAGWIAVRPELTAYLVIAGLTAHWFNNAFFVAISLGFSSEGAVWVPFPFLFVLMSVMINFRRIKAALNLQGVVDLVQRHDLLSLVLLWAVIAAMATACNWLLGRKRVFA